MSKNTQITSKKQDKTLLSKIGKLLNNSIVQTIIGGVFVLLIEYKLGVFQEVQRNSDYSGSPLWVGIATLTTIFIFIYFLKCLRIHFNSQNYFREEFSSAVLCTIILLIISLVLSISGQQMFWYPLVAVSYIVSSQKLTVSQTSWEGYAFLSVLIMLFYFIAFIRHQNWDGLKSIQQHQRDQRSEPSNIFSESIGEFKRILNNWGTLEKYSESDYTQLLNPLEQSEDLISQAWKEQARELLRLSSSSYVIDQESGWHDKQGCWVGRNIDTGKLFFIYPAQSKLSKQDLDNFVRYSREFAKSQNCQISELIVAFRENRDKSLTPTDSHKDIRFETEHNLLEKLVNFTDYRNDIHKRVLINKLPESDLALDDVYVSSQLLLIEKKRADDNVEDYLRKWLDEPSQRQIALLGEYGQGKSSATLMFTYRLLCEGEQLPQRIPILIELRGKSPRDLRPLELLGAWASQYRIDPQALMRLHIAGRLVLIFEGFDEMALIGNSELRLRHFRSLWRFCYPNAKIIITGRPNFFLDDREMKTALGIIKPISNKPYCEAIRLAPFSIDQIQEALRKQKPLVRDQICSLAKSETRFLELVSRPSLLHVVSVLWEKEKLYEKTALLNSAYVMECFVRSSYRRQGLKVQGSREFMALNSSERDYYMCGIASYMAAEQLSNQISNEQLNNLIDDLTEVIPESVSTSPPEIFGEDTRPLQLRIQDPKEDIEHIKTDVRTCGLLIDDPSAPGTFKFGHKSFMEYLFAATVKEYIWDNNSEKAKAVRKVTNFPIETILDLPVSVGFLAEMIGTDAAAKQINTSNDINLRGELTVASRLLKEIFSLKTNSVSWLILCFTIFSFSYFASGKKLKPVSRQLIRFTNPLLIILIVINVPVYMSLLNYEYNSYTKIFASSMATFTLFTITESSFSKTSSRKSIFRKLCLWNSICKELQIDDKVLHKIAGTSLLPWVKNQPFDYFLKNSQNTKSPKNHQ